MGVAEQVLDGRKAAKTRTPSRRRRRASTLGSASPQNSMPLIDAALTRAKGLSYLVTRDAKTGKFVRVTRRTLASTDAATEVWEKEPDISAIRDLLDRAIGEPTESVEIENNPDWDAFRHRINEARQRFAEDKRRKGEC